MKQARTSCYINVSGFNIDEKSNKLPFAKINCPLINHLVQYTHLLCMKSFQFCTVQSEHVW